MKKIIFLLILFIVSVSANAQLNLKAAKAPGGQNAWEQPAQISYLNNSGGESSSAIDAALSLTSPNLPGSTAQAQLSAWIGKNSLATRAQDKRGIEAAIFMAYGDAGFGFLPKLLVSADHDLIKKTDERTYEATIDLTSVPINLGGCGNALSKGCTYWDLMGGAYSNDVRSSDNGAGRGRVNGARIVIQLHSFPFPETTSLAPLSLTLSVEGQWDISASADRIKQDRHIVKAALGWKFYVGNPKYKPSIALVRVVGSNLLTGQENVAYTQLALRLEI